MGVRLFERLPEGYVLSAVGEEVLREAQQARAAVDAMARTAAGRDTSLAGDVRLTTAPNLARQFVPGALAQLRRAHPGIRVEVVVSDSDYDLARREADLALRATSRPPDYLIGRRVLEVRWFVMAGKAYLRKSQRRGRCRIWRDTPSLAPTPASSVWKLSASYIGSFLGSSSWQSANTLDTMAALTTAGLGLAVLPGDQVGAELVRLFPFEPPVSNGLWLLTHPDLRRVARIRAVSDAIFGALTAHPGLATAAGAGDS